MSDGIIIPPGADPMAISSRGVVRGSADRTPDGEKRPTGPRVLGGVKKEAASPE